MPKLLLNPSILTAAGTPPKRIEEFVGRVNSGHSVISVARMRSPAGWREPGQRPDFQEISIVLSGQLRVEYDGGCLDAESGQAVVAMPGEWVRYSTPRPQGAEYIAVCVPAFSPDAVHRDEETGWRDEWRSFGGSCDTVGVPGALSKDGSRMTPRP